MRRLADGQCVLSRFAEQHEPNATPRASVSTGILALLFMLAAAVSLRTSWVLVGRLERVGARLGLTEALLGMLAALAADAPEITASVSAMAAGQSRIGAGVVIGSNVFNLAALLGLGAVVARRIALHRRVVIMEGAVAIWIAVVCLLVITAVLSPGDGLVLVAIVLAPYGILLGTPHERLTRLRLPRRWLRWIREAIEESEVELEVAFHPRRGQTRDVIESLVLTLVVVGASVAMEQAGARIGVRLGWPEVVTGGLLLAAVTSIPNASAAVYLARRGRGAATLSTAMNSNALNVTIGLLLPGVIAGLAAPSAGSTFAAVAYLSVTGLVLAFAYVASGLRRSQGWAIMATYAAFVAVLLAIA
jgi:cation:H+ antiporter